VLDFAGADVSVPLRFGDPLVVDASRRAEVPSAALVGPGIDRRGFGSAAASTK
jgi:hypothetical protein